MTASRLGHLLVTTSILLALSLDRAAAEPLKALIVNGQNNHDWVATSRSLRDTLRRTGRFTVESSPSPGRNDAEAVWRAWRPDFDDFDVVVIDYNGQLWPEPVREAFIQYVRGGGGVVMVHAANNAFPDWAEYDEMIGLGWRDASHGDRLTIEDATGKVVRTPKGEGPGAGHGRQHAFVVKVREPEHPIMKGLPPRWKHARDELYHGQRGPARNMTILSSAYSDPETGGTGAHEPITWFVPFGEGRVVTTVMGHHWRGQKDFDALHCVGFQTVLARSAEWAATGKVTLTVPESFPDAETTSIEDPSRGG